MIRVGISLQLWGNSIVAGGGRREVGSGRQKAPEKCLVNIKVFVPRAQFGPLHYVLSWPEETAMVAMVATSAVMIGTSRLIRLPLWNQLYRHGRYIFPLKRSSIWFESISWSFFPSFLFYFVSFFLLLFLLLFFFGWWRFDICRITGVNGGSWSPVIGPITPVTNRLITNRQ